MMSEFLVKFKILKIVLRLYLFLDIKIGILKITIFLFYLAASDEDI